MRMNSNTIFITGGTSGIGQGLAEAFHKLGNQVIISGRREDRLRGICAAHPGMRHVILNVCDAAAVREVARKVANEFPQLNCLINNAGIQQNLNLGAPLDERTAWEEININLVGTIRVAAEFLPHLKTQPEATLINVSSGLAFVPLARYPIYCATKAAIHSYTMSLRHQLKDTRVKVVELIPPYVDTELGGPAKRAAAAGHGPKPMSLDAFIAEAMKELATDADELPIADAKRLAGAASPETVRNAFVAMNR